MRTPGPEAAASEARFPPGFDAAGFARQAKLQFERLQAAYDAGDRAAMAEVMTPEMLAEISRDLAARGEHQPTEVVTLDAGVLEVGTEGAHHWASVRYTGLLREDGCMRFLGRYKDLLKVGGENVDPTEVESLLLADPRINHVAVVGIPDPRLSEVPVAFVIPEAGATLSEDDVVALCRGRIAGFKCPRRVFFVDAFPMTGSGKIQKYLLRERAQEK